MSEVNSPSPVSDTRRWMNLIWDHNPCLLLSTVLMLLGCYLINSAIDGRVGDDGKLWSLVGVINLYEACIIPLGLVLVRRAGRGQGGGGARDGWWLLLFEVLFLVNGTFLNVEPSRTWGWGLNGLLLVLAVVKGAVIFRGLGMRLNMRTWGFLVVQLALIYGLPVFFWQVKVDGVVAPHRMYWVWWVVGLLPLAYDLVARWEGRRGESAEWTTAQQVVRRVYLIGPWILLVAQVGFAHWADHSDYRLADAAPVLIGLACALRRVPEHVLEPAALRMGRMVLPAAAFFCSLGAESDLRWYLPGFEQALTPGLCSAGMVMVVYGYFVSLWTAGYVVAALGLMGMGWVMREWVGVGVRWLWRQVEEAARVGGAALPETAAGWGVLSVAAAFVLLGAGGAIGLRRRPAEVGVKR